MTKNEMLTEMINLYSFEHPIVIEFARLMDNGMDESVLKTILDCHKKNPVIEEEEEE